MIRTPDGPHLRVARGGAAKVDDHHPKLRSYLADDDGLHIGDFVTGDPDQRTGRMAKVDRLGENRVRLEIHHLAVDAVSWGSSLDDLAAARRGEELPPVPVQFRQRASAGEDLPPRASTAR